MNKRQKKKLNERYKKRMMYVMTYNRAHIEWAYARHLPIFKSLRNYQKAVKYRLHEHMRTGNQALMYYFRDEPAKNYDYLVYSLESWSEPRQCELSAKHLLLNRENSLDVYYERYNYIMAWKMNPINNTLHSTDSRIDKILDEFWRVPT